MIDLLLRDREAMLARIRKGGELASICGGARRRNTPAAPPRPLDLANRREVQAALARRYGSATRFWSNQGRVYLFSALPIRCADTVDGVVYVTRSTHDDRATARVWDRFYSTRVAAGGSGLGLAIVRSVAVGHGGSVGVHCAAGITAFWFELPV